MGFKFGYKNHRIGKSEYINDDQMDEIGIECNNSDNMYVYCDKCGRYMEYNIGEDYYGDWICPECATKVREETAYHQLERENESWAKEWLGSDNEFGSDVPEGCVACGGPYPECKSGCNLFY